MKEEEPNLLAKFLVKKKDRLYQFWKRNTNFKNIYSAKFLLQKADYIHNNPIQPEWRLVEWPEDYLYSTAAYYLTGRPFKFFKLAELRDLV
jgi:putative transposase